MPSNYSHMPHNNVLINNVPHIPQWSHKIITELRNSYSSYYNIAMQCTTHMFVVMQVSKNLLCCQLYESITHTITVVDHTIYVCITALTL